MRGKLSILAKDLCQLLQIRNFHQTEHLRVKVWLLFRQDLCFGDRVVKWI